MNNENINTPVNSDYIYLTNEQRRNVIKNSTFLNLKYAFNDVNINEIEITDNGNYYLNYCDCCDDNFVELIKKNTKLEIEEIKNNVISDLGHEHKYLDGIIGLLLLFCKPTKGRDLYNYNKDEIKISNYPKINPVYRENAIMLLKHVFKEVNDNKINYQDCARILNIPHDSYIYLPYMYLDKIFIFTHGVSIRCAYSNISKSIDNYTDMF